MNRQQLESAALHFGGAASARSRLSPDHGERHWRDVARMAHAIWAEGVDADATVLFLFAALHDTQRWNEYHDPDHGPRAAAILMHSASCDWIRRELTPTQKEQLIGAVRGHDSGNVTDDPTIGACWDADRLTLPRVGIEPDLRFFSTDKVREDFVEFVAVGKGVVLASKDVSWSQIAQAYDDGSPIETLGSEVRQLSRNFNRHYAMLHRTFSGGELVPELKACLFETEQLGTWIGHPLIHTHFFDLMANHYNEMLTAKKRHRDEAWNGGNWHGYVFIHERPYRFDAMMHVLEDGELDLAARCELIADVWIDSENIYANRDNWAEVLEALEYGALCNAEEREKLDAMDDTLTIYRGTCAEDELGSGMSWTLSRKVAAWFARRLYHESYDRCAPPRVITATVRRELIRGYLTGRGEDEIVVKADDVVMSRVDLIAPNPEDREEAAPVQ